MLRRRIETNILERRQQLIDILERRRQGIDILERRQGTGILERAAELVKTQGS